MVTIVPERFADLASTADTADDPVPTAGQVQATRQFEPAAANASEGPFDRDERTGDRSGVAAVVEDAAISETVTVEATNNRVVIDGAAIDASGAPAPPSALAEESRPDRVVAVPGYDELPSGGPDVVAAESGDANASIEVAGLSEALEPPEPPALERRSDEGRVFGTSDGQPRIVIRATADSWVQVNDATGSLVMTRILRPGDSYAVPDANGLNLITGNAGGLEILVDGERIPSLGGDGVVLRNIGLDASRLVDGTAVPN